MEELKRIGTVAQELGISIKAIRRLEAKGLLPELKRGTSYHGSAHRLFSPLDIRRLRFIVELKELEFAVGDIKHVLERSTADCPASYTPRCPHIKGLLLRMVNRKIRDIGEEETHLKSIHTRLLKLRSQLKKN